MTQQPQSALVVDGVWGMADIVFSSAIYERYVSIEKAEYQIYHAARTYLAMLDDLARDPANFSQYQSEESKTSDVLLYLV
jgi:hypothetical protein